MSDLIDRQAAIDDIWTVSPLAHLDREWIDRWLRQLPSANNSEFSNSSDTISRQAAIEAIDSFNVFESRGDQIKLEQMIGELPPAQPEQLSTNLAEVGTDCISRQAAIDIIEDFPHGDVWNVESMEEMVDRIKQLPPIQPEPHWIPVDLENNEPPLEEWVLVSSDGYVMQDCIVERGGGKIWYHGGNIQADDRYMPLPEPYKPTVPSECEGDCGWCKPTVIEKCKGVTK